MLRFIAAGAWTVIFLIASIPAIIVELIVGLFSETARAISAQWIISHAFTVLLLICGTKVILKGLENIPKGRPVLFIPNHRSIFDVIITYTKAPKPTGYVAKKETKRVPIFNIWMHFMHCRFLNRDSLRDGLKMINDCSDMINKGISVCIFPEGTRNKSSEPLLAFHDGSLKIAEKSKCPIIPVTINNSDQIFEAHMPFVRKTTVVVEYGKPIETENLDRHSFRQLSTDIQSIIRETYKNNAAEI